VPTTVEEITRVFDADNHYWETSDAFTRHRDPRFNDRGLQVKAVDGVLRYVIDGQVFQGLPGPAVTRDGMRSPADPMFDRFWGLAQEADVVVAPHAGADLSYADFSTLLSRVWGQDDSSTTSTRSVATMLDTASPFAALMRSRLIHDFAFVLVAHRLFERFPRLRVAYIENGGAWVPPLLHTLEYLGHRGDYRADPKDQFIEHCWVAPFVEEDVDDLARYLPVERILFGSDWPHGEGYPEPRDFFENVANFSLADQRRIMYDNARELTFG
jgi:predicted TIM-barrel fold metal-dependent hydrolase